MREVDATVIPAWAAKAEEAGFSTLGTVGRIAYPAVLDTVAPAAAAGATRTIGRSAGRCPPAASAARRRSCAAAPRRR
ncbi:hypothetical protein QRX50_28320 [Amycolatopsis carbonis]|uniref:Uncharacterized protein n=1 Tax=Amycolatopsis carbonis TaxID=715471 RepID=A0A9Y2IA96_9PSEU|nr:hypothetical protein [Amycolatopsis sp. 2-15]WIX75420.1 hypothetical protein QRX50_28320 [Amycolatopsis sp. 2-15]